MAWGRGLLRLWIVLSVFWAVALMAGFRADETITNYLSAKSALGDRDGYYSFSDLSRASQNAAKANDSVAVAWLEEMAERAIKAPDGKIKSQELIRLESAASDLKLFATLIFAPILVTFLIGAALLWAFRGFMEDAIRK